MRALAGTPRVAGGRPTTVVPEKRPMCYVLLLGTDAPDDLSRDNAGGVVFSRELPGLPVARELALPHRWFVRVGTCSCGFRHLYHDSVALGFAEPVDWFPEDADHLEATRHVIQTIRRLWRRGAAVECIDTWEGSGGTERPLETLVVDLRGIRDAEFRFFEGYRFVFDGHTGEDR
jgi:hypothetical protein